MSRTVIFAGTTEGRELAEAFAKAGVTCDMCVATEYGNEAVAPSEYILVHQGRLDAEGMRELYRKTGCEIVVDATHPHATIATQTIQESIRGTECRYIRLIRPKAENGNWREYASSEECAKALEQTEGNVFLATGSKDLKHFCKNEELRRRLVVRVLPGLESITLCHEAGLNGKQIVAMQGPFSKEMNEATYSQYHIRHAVTKESGTIGGFDTKILAAEAVGAVVHVIRRPENDNDTRVTEGLTMGRTKELLNRLLGISLPGAEPDVCLVGIGCGSEMSRTVEADRRIEASDVVFGAPRMLEHIRGSAVKYPYYLGKDILPVIDALTEERSGTLRITVLFSGDSGFYSGAQKLYGQLREHGIKKVSVLPGISSLSMLSARTGISWQDASIVSLHGTAEEQWLPELLEAVRYSSKTFLIFSGPEDVRKLPQVLRDIPSLRVVLGRNLSYPDETVRCLSLRECAEVEEPGLYCGFLLREETEKRLLAPTLRDEEFLREKVPMTKQDIRRLSVCRLQLREGDIFYDIGSGTGSIAVQAAILSPKNRVFALECEPEAAELIRRNAEKHHCGNIQVLETMAPEGLEQLPKADCTFIGGSRGNLQSILECLYRINPKMRVVMNAVSMESIAEMHTMTKKFPVQDLEISQVNVSNVRKLGGYSMLQANNPVYICSFVFGTEENL